MSFRYDAGKIGKVERTPQGGIRVSANLTRTGVFEYRRSDGSIQRELRHPDHVFDPESIATLEDATLTHLHPSKVTSKDYKRLSIGHVRNPQRSDADTVSYVTGTAVIQDGETVEKVDSGKLKELSCGYSCDIVNTPGEYHGEKYDAVQTNIRYNHVALGPENWGRAGKSVALRLDSAGDMVLDDKDERKMEFETINGIKYTVGTPEHLQALRQDRDTQRGRADSLQTSLDSEKSRADEVSGKFDALTKERNDAAAPEAIDQRVNDTIKLREQAVTILGKEYAFTRKDGDKVVYKTPREIMVDAVKKADSSFDGTNETDDYIRGRFAHLSTVRKDSRANLREVLQNPAVKKKPENDGRNDSKKRDLSTQPLTLSKDK